MTASPNQDHQELPPFVHAKVNLKTWWNHFTFAQKAKNEAEANKGQNVVFGKPLKESLKYASVQISTANANGELYVWGYIPVVVAKSGLHLKEQATEVEGTFRVNGSNRRMRELQAKFETPPRYGKDLDWKSEPYTTHDVASVFRRFLTQMPETVIPYNMYHDFRNALAKKPYNQDEVIATYKRLIRSMPRANQYLLLYVLDLLSVFARKSDKNLMTPANLAVIFRPAILSHPDHELLPKEHQLSQDVLEFLIAHQDWFMLDIPPPPQSTSSTGHREDSDVMPSSDDELGGGWKLVNKTDSMRITRRRTMTEKTAGRGPLEERLDDLSPVAESPSPSEHGVHASGSMKRSKTLPHRSRRGTADSTSQTPSVTSTSREGDRQQARVLRKQKRASIQPGTTPSV